MGLKDYLNNAGLFISNNSSTILTVLGVIGVGITVRNAVVDARKAEVICCETEPRNVKEEIQDTWKCYIPTAISATATIGCIVGSHICSEHQKEAIGSAYLLTQATLTEYQRRVAERVGTNKEREIYQEVIQDLAEKQAPQQLYSDGGMAGEVVDTGHGNTLFYDTVVPGGLYFKSDINYLRSKVNDLNFEVRTEMYFDWNEIYYRWGLPRMKYGSEMIFDVDHPFEIRLTPEMMDNGQIRVLLDYDLFPKSLYHER